MRRFDSAPHHLVDAFRLHVAETGQPETFPGISNDRPPSDGEVVALATGFGIDRRKRPQRDEAPCPICSRGKPKWIRDGSLIWCAETQAIYAIGPDCYRTLWTDGRMDVALNLLRRTQREHDNVKKLEAAIAALHSNRAWIERHLPLARRADSLHREVARNAPNFRRSVSRQLKSGLTTQVLGVSFLRGTWRLEEKLRRAEKELAHFETRAGADPTEWATQLSARVVEERLGEFRKALSAMDAVARYLNDLSQFLASANIKALAVWSSSAVIPFTAHHTLLAVEIRCGDEFWRGPLGLPSPDPLPA